MSRLVQTTLSVLIGLCIALWAEVAAADIDVAACPPAPPVDVITITNNLAITTTIEIAAINATSDYEWGVDSSPNFVGAGSCTGSSPYNCSGVVITVPSGPQTAASGNPVTITGTPTVEGSIFFKLIVFHAGNECGQTYQIDIVNPAVPFDLFFVLDHSGSMTINDGDVAGTTTTRWGALKAHSSSVKGIAAGLTNADQSRFGARLFATNIINWPAPNAALSSLGDILTAPQTNYDTALDDSPNGSTAMGEGLDAGRTAFTTNDHNKVLILFTDGEQNTGRMVTTNTPNQVLIGGAVADFTNIKVFTVGMGNPSAPYQTLLQDVAANTGGTYIADNAVGAAFEDAVATALQANSPQLVTRVVAGTATSVEVGPFPLNRGVQRLLLRYTFNQSFPKGSLGLFANGLRITRNGVDESARLELHTVEFGDDWVVVAVDFTAVRASSEGTFVVKLVDVEERAVAATPVPLKYDVSVIADDHWFEVEHGVTPSPVTVDSAFKPSVTLNWLDGAVEDATVTALVLQPGDDLGDLLAKNGTTVDVSSDPDAGSPGYQKYLHLMADSAFVAALKASEHAVPLAHQGNGVYSGYFSTTDISGVHQVMYTVTVQHPELGKVERVFRQSVFVRPGPIDQAKSGLTGKVDGSLATLSFRPITVNGRFLGPAQAGGFVIDTPAGVTVTKIVDKQDGSYDIVLEGNAASIATTEIKVTFLDQPVYSGTVQGFIDGGGDTPPTTGGLCHEISSALGIPCWLFWVIVGVLVLLIIIVIIRRRNR